MPTLLIQDFLQTQGLKLPLDEVRVAYAAAQAVINMGHASIDQAFLWPEKDGFCLAEHIEKTPENETVLKQIFMALDSVFSRCTHIQSAAVYAQMPSENFSSELIALTLQGQGLERRLPLNENNSQIYLACRTAQSGWMNVVNDVPYWLELGELNGERNTSMSQISIPICTRTGAVLGVIQIEYFDKNQADDSDLSAWVALSLALSEPLKSLLNVSDEDEQDV